MRRLLIMLIIASAVFASGDRLSDDKGKLLNCAKCYGLSRNGVRFIVALALYENGPKGNELGHDNPRANREVFGNPCLREDSLGYAQGTVAFLKILQEYTLRDDFRRREFIRYFARIYHAGGKGKNDMERAINNEAYRKTLGQTWLRARNWIEQNMKPEDMGYCEECYGGTPFR